MTWLLMFAVVGFIGFAVWHWLMLPVPSHVHVAPPSYDNGPFTVTVEGVKGDERVYLMSDRFVDWRLRMAAHRIIRAARTAERLAAAEKRLRDQAESS